MKPKSEKNCTTSTIDQLDASGTSAVKVAAKRGIGTTTDGLNLEDLKTQITAKYPLAHHNFYSNNQLPYCETFKKSSI